MEAKGWPARGYGLSVTGAGEKERKQSKEGGGSDDGNQTHRAIFWIVILARDSGAQQQNMAIDSGAHSCLLLSVILFSRRQDC